MEVKEVLDEVMSDKDFYRNSGGGITVSGGEPLSQVRFVSKLLEASKKEGLHTTLDTSGLAPWEKMEQVLRFVDLVLFDIKHLDSHEHKRVTGVENELILENLKKVARIKDVWLRLPLIADFDDSEEYIRRVVLLGKDLGVKKISLLPYHEGGRSKSEQIGRPYPIPEAKTPGDEHVNYLKELIEKEGIKASIGN